MSIEPKPFEPFDYPEYKSRKKIGPNVFIEDSVPEARESVCPFCSQKETPFYISMIRVDSWSKTAWAWFCGKEECVMFFLLRNG